MMLGYSWVTIQLCLWLLVLVSLWQAQAFFRGAPSPYHLQTRNRNIVDYSSRHLAFSDNGWDLLDEEEVESFRGIASRYLSAKFQACVGSDCTYIRSLDEVKNIMREVLPPVDDVELKREVGRVLRTIGKTSDPKAEDGSAITVDEFVNAIIGNVYWQEAGPVVVRELIFLDTLYHFYHKKRNLLNDEDYNELKDQLMWEGSMTLTITGKEALFITAVAAHHRGMNVLSNNEYESLKKELQTEDSWVVKRQADPLERMGLQSFLGYLHRSLS